MSERDFEAEKTALLKQIRKASIALQGALFDLLRWSLDDPDPEFKRVHANFMTAVSEKYKALSELNRQYDGVVFWQGYDGHLSKIDDENTVYLHENTHEMYHDPITDQDMWINTAYADDEIDDAVNKIMGL